MACHDDHISHINKINSLLQKIMHYHEPKCLFSFQWSSRWHRLSWNFFITLKLNSVCSEAGVRYPKTKICWENSQHFRSPNLPNPIKQNPSSTHTFTLLRIRSLGNYPQHFKPPNPTQTQKARVDPIFIPTFASWQHH